MHQPLLWPPAPTQSTPPAMIKTVFISTQKPWLSKFHQLCSEYTQEFIREAFHLACKRDENVCNYLGGSDNKLIYRHHATLYFVFCVSSSESELDILDFIQVFVETLDKCFENVCELDSIFPVDKVSLAGTPAHVVLVVKNMNLHEIPPNINISDISIKVLNLSSFK
ncbi:AP-3 complex subunit sigma-1-like [Tamandua tetradactyla]|uniref:AP-3 complex subunit sigma-1-like n=1 Tax=Tamandua tetradactyla TaxID=48850 RepID=UPI0040539178